MTLNDWQKRDDLKSAWKEFFQTECGKAVVSVLSSLGTPAPTMSPVGVDFIDWNALMNARREGFYEAVRTLSLLAENSTKPEQLPEPWEQPKQTERE